MWSRGPAVDGSPASVDSAASHVWLSAALGVVAIPGRDRRESQRGLPSAQAEGVVRASTVVDPAPPGAGLDESGQSE